MWSLANMPGHKVFPAILQAIFIILVARSSSGWRYDGIGVAWGPTVIPTRGQIWPKPLMRAESDNYLTVQPYSFNFKVVGQDCYLLQEAFKRYYVILVSSSRHEPPTTNLKTAGGIYTLGYLDTLLVNLSSPCEGRPHPGMIESYQLTVSKANGALLSSESVWGILRGLETFVQTVTLSPDGSELIIKESSTTDSPRYPHRGLLLDTSRHFLPIGSIVHTLDAMEASKMNVFHWHIVDDQAFPYQSERFPELSNEGAYHPRTHVYTRVDIEDIIEYARLRGIRVIPEFDTPGHTRSWGQGKEGLLTPCYKHNNQGEVVPDGSYGPIDPTKPETFEFLEQFFEEAIRLFPDEYIHLGGDEVNFECWKSNPAINDYMNANDLTGNYAGLEQYYIQSLVDKLKKFNVSNIVWQEVFDNGVKIDPSTVVQVWIDSDSKNEMSRVTADGHPVLFSSCWYLSTIASGGDWKKFYSCDPEEFPGTADQKKLVQGGEACMWGEYVDWSNVESRVWPRACAIAEKLWTSPEAFKTDSESNSGYGASSYDIKDVEARLEEHRCRLLRRGIQAQPPNEAGFCPGEYW